MASPSAPAVGTLPRGVRTSYAIGSVGTGGFGTLPGLVLSYYLTDTLGIGAGIASLMVTVPKVWDVLVDPFVGRLSDTSARRRGSRTAFMLAGALTLPVAFVLLFAAPGTGVPAAAWVVAAFLLATTAFSLFQVPYIALPAELAHTPQARTRLLAPRIAVLALAILAFGAGGPMVRDAAGSGRTGYLVMAVVCGLVMGVGMLVAALGAGRAGARTQPRQVAGAAPAPGAARAGLAALRESAPLRALLSTFVLQALATGAMLAAAQYVATYVLGEESAVTFLFVALVAPALLVMVPARRVADRIGKRTAFVASTVLFAAATASLTLMSVHVGWWVYAAVGLAGIAYAGMQLYPLAMLPDVIAADRAVREDGPERAGVIAGIWTAGETGGLALGPTLALVVLAVSGFVSRTGGAPLPQPASALLGVVLIFSVLPAALALCSLIPLSRYRLTDGETS
ncbi:MFS transporter [Ruania alba]|uniref:Na+/melibiose symporter n=1 Tax=Ruania alba TaxID=648782 RepID=A0A1H5FTN7_9MICO|nr:MFS transporter [Ruania alba]SEE06737.1 Na+/melibiose symporter [Ruania alba]